MLNIISIYVFLSLLFASNTWMPINGELEESMKRGAMVYEDFCMNCHMPDGKGTPQVFPPLAGSDYLMEKRSESIHAIKYGISGEIIVNGEVYNGNMSSQGLDNSEVADVINYILNSWGNEDGQMVTAAEVSKIEP